MGNSFFSDCDKGVKGESAQDKVPSCGHVQSITGSTRPKPVGPLRGSALGAGIEVTTEKDVCWERGRCIVEGQLINAGSPQKIETEELELDPSQTCGWGWLVKLSRSL